VRAEVEHRWSAVDTDHLDVLGDKRSFVDSLRQIYGFGFPEVAYRAEVNSEWPIAGLG
jgi:trans-2-enoyl-CoA reductase